MTELTALQGVPAPLRPAVGQLAERLQQYGGPRVHSLVLYGPVAQPTFDADRDVVRTAIVMDSVDLVALRRLATEGHRFGRARIIAPLVLTPAFIRESLDTYPLELIEIQQSHVLVFGDDFFAPLEFEHAHVRLQCERELKVLALAMRQAVVSHGDSERSLRKAAWPPLLGLVRILRGICWLRGRRDALPPTQLVLATEQILDLALPGIRRAAEVRGTGDWPAIEALYHDIERLGNCANGW